MPDSKPAMRDLGWLNEGPNKERDEAKAACTALGHERTDIDVGPPHRGIDHVVTCEICGFRYHYDSSD